MLLNFQTAYIRNISQLFKLRCRAEHLDLLRSQKLEVSARGVCARDVCLLARHLPIATVCVSVCTCVCLGGLKRVCCRQPQPIACVCVCVCVCVSNPYLYALTKRTSKTPTYLYQVRGSIRIPLVNTTVLYRIACLPGSPPSCIYLVAYKSFGTRNSPANLTRSSVQS